MPRAAGLPQVGARLPVAITLRALSRLTETATAVDGAQGLGTDPGNRLMAGTAERAGGAEFHWTWPTKEASLP